MAIVDVLSIPVTADAPGTKRTLVQFPAGLDVADIQAWWDVAAPEFDLIHDGITGVPSLTTQLTNPGGLKVSAVVDSTIRRGGLLAFTAVGTNFSWSQVIPAIGLTYVLAGAFNTDHADIVAWRTRMLLGEAGPPARLPSNRHGEDLLAFKSGQISFRK